VVTHESKGLVLDCLASLEACASGIPHDTFVVDNASSDGTAEAVARGFPSVEVIARSSNDGFAVANNEALRRARGRHTLLLNPDTQVLPGALEAMIEFLDEHPRTGMVGCRLVDGAGNVDASASGLPGFRMQVASWLGIRRLVPRAALRRALAIPRLKRILELLTGGYFTPAGAGQGPREVDFLSGACILARRELWDTVGLMDERFFLFLEDADICRRAAAAGWLLHYLPGPAIVHLGGRSFAARSGGATHHVSPERAHSLVYYFRKHGGRGQELAIRALIAVAVTPRLLLALARGDRARAARLRSMLRVTMTPLPAPGQ
jgi:N-acetylglucosaminyl-diphospho-decaprenol L-rhamnosyltransferase